MSEIYKIFVVSSNYMLTNTVLAVCLLSITALEKMTDFVGENFALYLGQSLGDLVVITLDKFVPPVHCRQIPYQPFLQHC